MLARAQQMVDMLTEENRQLKQEMEVFGEKVSKLQKVRCPDLQELQFFFPSKCKATFMET